MSQITTHVLDASLGKPAAGVPATLFYLVNDDWQTLASGITNADGRIPNLLGTQEKPLPAGTYRMHFNTHSYLQANNLPVFYPFVDIVFCMSGEGEHYHIPLLLSPYSYSTYRGS